MPEPIESQLRALAKRIDDAVEPVRADDVMVAEMTPRSRHRAQANTGRALAAVVALAAIVTGVVVVARQSDHGAPTASTHTTAPNRLGPAPMSWTDQLPRCGPEVGPPPVTQQQAGVRISIVAPGASMSSLWTATVTNVSNTAVSVGQGQTAAYADVSGAGRVSVGAIPLDLISPAEVAPGGHSSVPFTIGTTECGPAELTFDLPGGTYSYLVPVEVDNRLVYSAPFLVDVAPNGAARPHGSGPWQSLEHTTGAGYCGRATPAPTTDVGVTARVTPHATGLWSMTLDNTGPSSVATKTYRKKVGSLTLSPETVAALLVDGAGRVRAVTLRDAAEVTFTEPAPAGETWPVDVFVATRSCSNFTKPPAPGNYMLVALVDLNGSTYSSTPVPVTVDAAGALAPSHAAPVKPTAMCLFARTDVYTLRQPITITLPGRQPVPIVPGSAQSEPNGVTLDGDGSTEPGDPGYAQGAATLFWGATTPGGPFEHLDQLRPGQIITIAQEAAGTGCVQHWRVFAQLGTGLHPTGRAPGPLELVLVGFVPNTNNDVYVDAVPAS